MRTSSGLFANPQSGASKKVLLVITGALALGFCKSSAGAQPYEVTGVAIDDVLNLREEPDAGAALVGALSPVASGIDVERATECHPARRQAPRCLPWRGSRQGRPQQLHRQSRRHPQFGLEAAAHERLAPGLAIRRDGVRPIPVSRKQGQPPGTALPASAGQMRCPRRAAFRSFLQ